MNRRALALAAAALALAAGCNKGTSGPAFRLAEPSSVAIFRGYAHAHTTKDGKEALLWPYAAVANSALNELILFDPVDNKVLPAPIVIRPLSIPLPSPRPALVTSAAFTPCALSDADPACLSAAPRPDLVVVVAAGSTELQLIRTWKSSVDPAAYDYLALDPGLVLEAPVDLGSEVVALVATPKVDGSGLVPDRVRVVAALADGRLAVVEYQWSGDPSLPEVLPPTDDPTGQNRVAAVSTTGDPAHLVDYQDPDFDALSLAVDPSLDENRALRNPTKLYAATLDPIPPSNTFGVAEFDMTGAAGSWTMRALNAHTPTRLVAAFTLWERQLGVAGAYDQITRPVGPSADGSTPGNGDKSAFQVADAEGAALPPVHRVYAYRDPSSCGPMTSEQCGIAILDPDTADVLEDQWHKGMTPKQYMPAIAIPSFPVAMVPGTPAWHPPTDESIPDEAEDLHRFMLMTTGTGIRLTTGVLFIPCQNGRSYFADLARWEIPSNTWEISLVGSFCTVSAYRASETDRPQIGFYEPKDLADADKANGSAATRNLLEPTTAASGYFKLTPGFTRDDIWNITYQGHLPDFASNRPATISTEGVPPGMLRVALQVTSNGTISQKVNVFDPAYGVRVGDIVEIWTTGMPETPGGNARCPDTTKTDSSGLGVAPIEGKIVEVTRPNLPSDSYPGGSLVIQPGDCVPIFKSSTTSRTRCDSLTHGPWFDPADGTYQYNGCWNLLAGTVQQVRIRASGGGDPSDATPERNPHDFVLAGAGAGYAGRATSVPSDPPPNNGEPFPSPDFSFSDGDEALACPLIPYPSDPTAVPDCDESCRLTCEKAAVARRARRTHLPSVYCFKSSSEDPKTRNYCETHFPEFAVRAKQDQGVDPLGTFDQAVGNHAPGEPPTGPALAFSLGVRQPATTSGLLLVRDTQVIIATRSGYQPVNRFGGGANSGASTGPMGAAYFDRSFDKSWGKQPDRYRFFVPYVGNLILDASPAHNNGDTRVLR